ncbi:MAG: outer membrane lipoprotein chaperone LolA [Xanthomonadales bacterium]|nr:outer membrane lipoprotein chaperone LolA [Xanthomonadales bacterium]
MIRLAVAAGLLAVGLPALALEPLDRVRQFSSGLEAYQSEFQQVVVDETGRVIEESSGNMALAVPNRLRWHYLEDFEQIIVADGDKVWSYDVELEQVTVKDQAQAVTGSPLYLLMEPGLLETDYELKDLGPVEGIDMIQLIPREPRSDFEWIELGFSGGNLQRLTIRDAFGQQTFISFSQGVRNPQLSQTAFQFTPPEGIDVLGADELDLGDINSGL